MINSLNFKFQSLKSKISFSLVFSFLLSFSAFAVVAQPPSPKSFLGFHPTTQRTIADWSQISKYFNALDKSSDKVTVQEIGQTTLGKSMFVALISAPENLKNLEKYRQINAKLADPRNIKDQNELEKLLAEGKTIVSISCSIHSNEIVASQMSMNLAYQLATATDSETLEILEKTILLLIPSSNPDGIDIVADWYRKTLGTPFEGSIPPELYHHYAGHDNNRDWFMMNLVETRNITKLYWQEWFPQIVYDVHQMGQNGARFIIPPFYDPPNPNIPPLILREVGLIGYKMAADLQAAKIKGVATNTTFDTWWHGGFRSAPYYRNSIGILSEAASANLMTPVKMTEERMKNQRARGLNSPFEASTSHPDPWTPNLWTPEEIAQIEMIASRSLLTLSAKFRENYLRNFYQLNKISATPNSNPSHPKAYVVFASQGKEEIVARFLEILLWQGVEFYRLNHELMTSMIHHGEKEPQTHEVPLDSFIIFLDQPQRNNVEALLGKQVYPQRLNEKGEAEVPYDVAGWTLPLQMGIETAAITAILSPQSERKYEKIQNINQIRQTLNMSKTDESFSKFSNPLKTKPKIGLYRGWTNSMDEGWTRLVFDNFQIPYTAVSDKDFRENKLNLDVLVLPSQNEKTIVSGLKLGEYPTEYTGGITQQGVENLKKFVENGGNLICFDDSCELVIKNFGLPIKNVLSNLKRNEFYCPGSILNLEVDKNHPLTKGISSTTAGYFINSSAFEINDLTKVKKVADYAQKDLLLSGWLLGENYLKGKTALAETTYGKGKITLFAFRPQHRGQTFATFPFIFNALEK